MLLIFFNLIKKLKIFLLFSISLNFILISNSNSQTINKIEIQIPINTDYKILNNALDAKANNLITEHQKKSYQALLRYSDKIYDAKIRLHGDLVDHLNLENLIYSFDINLKNGTIEGIKEFKLLLKETRPFEELLLNKILKAMGYIVPHLEIVEVSINKREYKAIFIEKPNEFLLERLQIREGPIYRGDERVWWDAVNKRLNKKKYQYPDYLTFRLSNQKYVGEYFNEKIDSRISKTLFAIYGIDKISYSNIIGLDTEEFFCSLDKGCAYFQIVHKYSPHSLLPNNVIFYHNIFSNEFMPIFWDGGQRVTETCQITDIKIKNHNSYNSFFDEVKNDLLISNINLTPETECIIMDSYSIFERYSNIINDIDYYNFDENKFTEKKSSQIIWFDLKKSKFETCYSKNALRIKLSSIIDCDIEQLQQEIYSSYLGGSFKSNKKIYTFVGSNSLELLKKFPKKYEVLTCSKINCEFSLDKISIIHLKNEYINNLDIKLTNINARAIINDQDTIINKIELIQDFKMELKQDTHPITGCLTILNSNIQVNTILSNNSLCEDSLNIVNSKGKINHIKINNSQFDGLDSDFSEFEIGNLEIDSSKNDCADWSFSNFNIDVINVKNCFDKGLSIGEKSKIVLKSNSNIDSSNIGVAVKEGSQLIIKEKLNIKNSISDCFLQYIKKPYLGVSGIIDGRINC